MFQIITKDHLPDHPFWRFVTKISHQDPAHKAIAWIQNNLSLQINLLLYCCWFAQAGQGKLTKNDISQLIAVSSNWHQRVSVSLQQLQKSSVNTSLAEDLKEEINENLALAEHIEQLMLTEIPLKFSRAPRSPSQKLNDACKNIALYFKAQQTTLTLDILETLQQLLEGIFSNIDPLDIQKTCQSVLPGELPLAYHQKVLGLN